LNEERSSAPHFLFLAHVFSLAIEVAEFLRIETYYDSVAT